MTQTIDAIILSVPYTRPFAMVAPVLISACLNKGGVSAKGIDFSIQFYEYFSSKPYWADLQTQLTLGHIKNKSLPRRAIIDILKFNKKFLLSLRDEFNPRCIGLSIFSMDSIDYSYILIYSIRKYLPNVKILIGGKGMEVECSIRKKPHYQIYIDNNLADLAVIGDCEHVIAKLVKENINGVYISSQQTAEDLDNSPSPKWDDYDLSIYQKLKLSTEVIDEAYMTITASKGCIRKCTFCDVGNFWPKYVYRNPDNVADEIINAHKATGIRNFLFTDNLINGSVSNYRKINQRLVEVIPNTIKYGGFAIFRNKDSMPDEDFELAKRAGCDWWAIGVESGSERLRFEQGKKITDEDLDWSVRNLSKVGIEQVWLMMVGYPSETDEDFQLTLELFKKYKHLANKRLVTISVTPTFMLLNNSPIMKNEIVREELGLSHNLGYEWTDKFWTSTKNVDNTFPVRAKRWRTAIKLIQDLGYLWPNHFSADLNKWFDEIASLEKVYDERKQKFIPVSQINNVKIINDRKHTIIPISQV